MDATLEDRLAALERAVTDTDHDCSALAEGAATADRVSDIEAELGELADRVAELEAATQALRGYVGNVRSVNADVEQRADLALSKAQAAHRVIDQHCSDETGSNLDSAIEQNEQDDSTLHSPAPHEGQRPTGTGPAQPRCRHCERPLDDEQRGPSLGDSGREASESSSAGSPLDTLREPTDARNELRAEASTETDGGSPEQRRGGAGDGPHAPGEHETDTGVLSRITSLL